jgi:hypothetical protein
MKNLARGMRSIPPTRTPRTEPTQFSALLLSGVGCISFVTTIQRIKPPKTEQARRRIPLSKQNIFSNADIERDSIFFFFFLKR